MEMAAIVVVRARVPIDFDVASLDLASHLTDDERPRIQDNAKYEKDLQRVTDSRIKAAKHAETKIIKEIKQAFKETGINDVIDVTIEGVEEL